MKLNRIAAVLVAAFLSTEALADEVRLETLSSAGASVASTVTLSAGAEYWIRCTAAAHYRACNSSSCTAVTTDFPLSTTPSLIVLRSGRTHVAIIPATGSADCYLYDSIPRLTTINSGS